MYDILIICTGNICRSPMAEGLLEHILPDTLKGSVAVQSAGTHAYDGLEAEPFAVRALLDRGIDIRSHRSRMIDDMMLADADLILAMEEMHREYVRQLLPPGADHVHLLGEFEPQQDGLEVPDPYGGTLETYQRCAQTINAYLEGVIDHLQKEVHGRTD
jgi:protein-tyrosine phosphatase